MQSQRVKVLIRVRPSLRDEHGGALVIGEDQQSILLHRADAAVTHHHFSFDQVLPPSSTQHEVFSCVRETVEDVMQGYNGTIMAYGQTGAGKTHTLSSISEQNIGVIPRAVAEIFQQASSDFSSSYTVHLSYVQLYMEMLQDLLNPESQNLQIREGDRSGVFLTGAVEQPIGCIEDALALLELGERHRTQAFTHLNSHSSRSHAIAILTVVKAKNPKFLTNAEKAELRKLEKEGQVPLQRVQVGRLFLVDLAGSERLKKSRSIGVRQSEAISINKSLTALGMCINARAEERQHVPFRDSKLTRLLQESLGGNARTTLIVCIADALDHVDETLQSLQFGSRAMAVKTSAVINEIIDYKHQYSRILEQLDEVEDTQHLIEVSLVKAEEERDAIRAEKEKEAARFQGILEELQRETLGEIASITALLERKDREAEEAVTAAVSAAMASGAKAVADKGGEIEKLKSELKARTDDVSILQSELEESEKGSLSLKGDLERALSELARTREELLCSQGRCFSLEAQVQLLGAQGESHNQELAEAKGALQGQRKAWRKMEEEVESSLKTLGMDEGEKEARDSYPRSLKIEDRIARMLRPGGSCEGAQDDEPITPHVNPAYESFPGAEEENESPLEGLVGYKSFSSQAGGFTPPLVESEGDKDGAQMETLRTPRVETLMTLMTPLDDSSQMETLRTLALDLGHGSEQMETLRTLQLDLSNRSLLVSRALAEMQRRIKDRQIQAERQVSVLTRGKEESSRLISELSSKVDSLEKDLSNEKVLVAELRDDARKMMQTRMDLFSDRIDVAKRMRAALSVQKAWRRWKQKALTSNATEVNSRLVSEIEGAKEDKRRRQLEVEAEAEQQRVELGRALVVSSVDMIRDAVEGITIAFLGRKKELETRARLAERVNSVAPILSCREKSNSLSTALSLLTQASFKRGQAKPPTSNDAPEQ